MDNTGMKFGGRQKGCNSFNFWSVVITSTSIRCKTSTIKLSSNPLY